MIAIDTNIVVRYLTGDHPEQSNRARSIVNEQPVFVAVTIALETEWVLRSAYGYSRFESASALRAFCGLPTVNVEDADCIAEALDLVEKSMDFGDALHLTRTAHCDGFVTFDRKLVKTAQAAGRRSVGEA
ncbi:type II toxin-antitoxin system VapC family toxin [Agrobacterium sp. DSM 25558]|uniref:type II toxin-antitoxin system VapC family toxin n=1 Tax=Agrobacterium sp. DSM 25558 TaxID=1907665 RepID=UPI00097DB341|nr:type II toxin-antitoxin system VapC family toxin [Agrobacterium sp. DSM 25558]